MAKLTRAFLKYGCRRVRIEGEQNLLEVLCDRRRLLNHRGVLSYCNHISVLDEPLMWGSMPRWTFDDPSTVRWTLGASDILFKNGYVGAVVSADGKALQMVLPQRAHD